MEDMEEQHPDIKKIFDWVVQFDVKPLQMAGMDKEKIILANNIYSKFEQYRTWALHQIEQHK